MKTYSGVVGFLELQKDRLVDYMVNPTFAYPSEEVHQMIGSGYNAACTLNLMGLLSDSELQAMGLLITQILRRC